MGIFLCRSQVDELVDGSQDKNGGQNIHQPTDKRGGHEGQYDAQNKTAKAHDGEIGPQRLYLVAVNIKNLGCGGCASSCAEVRGGGGNARQEKQDFYGNGNTLNGLFTVLYEQCAYDYGDRESTRLNSSIAN